MTRATPTAPLNSQTRRDPGSRQGQRRPTTGIFLHLGAACAAVAVFLASYVVVGDITGGDGGGGSRATVGGLSSALVERGESAAVRPGEAIDLPLFDPAELTLGGSGEAGAILAGPGVVPSVDHRTAYVIQIPTARMQAAIVGLGLAPDGALGAPDNPDVVGWWADGVKPGQLGNVLLDGHVDYTDVAEQVGLGVAWALREVQVGDPILIRDHEREQTYLYRVTETVLVGATSADGLRYLKPTVGPMLTFVTCEGLFDRAAFAYAERRVVRAVLETTVPFAEAAPTSLSAAPSARPGTAGV